MPMATPKGEGVDSRVVTLVPSVLVAIGVTSSSLQGNDKTATTQAALRAACAWDSMRQIVV
jgi:hypothetical protein